MARTRSTPRIAVRILAVAAVGFGVALVLPRQRWRDRTLELPAGPWPPLDLLSGG